MLGGLVVAGGNRGAGWETGAEGAPGPSRRPHFVPSCPLPPGGAGSGLGASPPGGRGPSWGMSWVGRCVWGGPRVCVSLPWVMGSCGGYPPPRPEVLGGALKAPPGVRGCPWSSPSGALGLSWVHPTRLGSGSPPRVLVERLLTPPPAAAPCPICKASGLGGLGCPKSRTWGLQRFPQPPLSHRPPGWQSCPPLGHTETSGLGSAHHNRATSGAPWWRYHLGAPVKGASPALPKRSVSWGKKHGITVHLYCMKNHFYNACAGGNI